MLPAVKKHAKLFNYLKKTTAKFFQKTRSLSNFVRERILEALFKNALENQFCNITL